MLAVSAPQHHREPPRASRCRWWLMVFTSFGAFAWSAMHSFKALISVAHLVSSKLLFCAGETRRQPLARAEPGASVP